MNRSEGVAKSWQNNEVRNKRGMRWICSVDGYEIDSVSKTCALLRYKHTNARHIVWRGKLVEAPNHTLPDEYGRIWKLRRIK